VLVTLKNFSWQHCMFFFCSFTLCSAPVSALLSVLSDSPCERIKRWETYLILKETDHCCTFSFGCTKSDSF
jgi:hypothetical protein